MPLHWQIILGLVLGLVYGIVAVQLDLVDWTKNWINPWGTIFVRLLKLIAVPLVLASLISGVASLSDLRKLSRIGGKTIAIYMGTTVVALTIGVVMANILRPGLSVPVEMREQLQEVYKSELDTKTETARSLKERSPLQPLVDMVPSNIFSSASDNRAMLQIVFFAIIFGIGLIQIESKKAQPMLAFFESGNEVVIKMVDMIMLMAPSRCFCLARQDSDSLCRARSRPGF